MQHVKSYMRISLMQQWGALFIISPAFENLDYLNA